MVVPDEKAQDAFVLADRCRQAVEAITLDLGSDSLRTTASFGVADATDSSSEHDLIKAADEALYRAKQLGRNRVELAAHTSQPAHPR